MGDDNDVARMPLSSGQRNCNSSVQIYKEHIWHDASSAAGLRGQIGYMVYAGKVVTDYEAQNRKGHRRNETTF